MHPQTNGSAVGRLRTRSPVRSGSSALASTSATHWGPRGRNSSEMRSTSAWPGSERRNPMSAWMSGSSPAEKMMVIASPCWLSSSAAVTASAASL